MYKSNKQAPSVSPDRALQIGSITEEDLISQISEIEEWVRQEPDKCRLRDFRDQAVFEIAQHRRIDISRILSPFFSLLHNRITGLKAKRSSNGSPTMQRFRIVALVSDALKVEAVQEQEEAYETVEVEELTTAEALSAELKAITIDPSDPNSLQRINEFRNFMEENGYWSVTSNGAIRIPEKGNSEEVSSEERKAFREVWKPLKKEVNVAEGQRAEELAKQEAQRAEELAKQEAQRAEELAKQEAKRNQEIENGIRKVVHCIDVVGVYPEKEVRAEVTVRFEKSAKGKDVVRIVSVSGDEIRGIAEGRVYPARFDGMPVALREALYPEQAERRNEQRGMAAA